MTRICTCLGSCRGAAGLSPGWRCALVPVTTKAPTEPDPRVAFLTAWADDFVRAFTAAHRDKLLEAPATSVHRREDGAIVVRLGDLVFKPGCGL